MAEVNMPHTQAKIAVQTINVTKAAQRSRWLFQGIETIDVR
ncbi:hypothetical protein X739_22110 [Mesorhizobium sp. LNHC220B00]|nr:hypothetical protein X739_22110 [Mesorhizobium sp. LNHC220B00]